MFLQILPVKVGSFLFYMISFKLCDFIQVSEDFSETSKKLFWKKQRAFQLYLSFLSGYWVDIEQ